MRSLLLAACGLFFTLVAKAEVFSIAETGISFSAPAGFTPLTSEEIATKFPANRAPKFVVGNGRRTTTIAYDLKPNPIPADKLAEGMASFQQLFERIIPGLEWKDRKLIELQGQKWIYLEMTSRAVDTDIHNIMLVTPYRGGMLIFNFNSTREEFPTIEAALRESLESIKLKSD